MAMNIKGIMTRINELRDGIEEAVERKQDAICNAEEREDSQDSIYLLEAQLSILETVLSNIEDSISELENWES